MTTQNLFPEPKANSIPHWVPTRAAGLQRLADFLPRAGRAYAGQRNFDLGPNDRSNVSGLSPWLSRRILSEGEVVRAIVAAHGFQAGEKFIQEVFWRTYWKGWLEARPQVYHQYLGDLAALQRALEDDLDLAQAVARARAGQTGIECFDAWVSELKTYGWLHNHARMWFASIWIFTLQLPWQLGAEFFVQHLLDADAASNTLSWRWVGGLHTKGKHYLARADNIEAFTKGRFDPHGQLNETAQPLIDPSPYPSPMPLAHATDIAGERIGLLVTQEDLNPLFVRDKAKVAAIALAQLEEGTSPPDPNTPKSRFNTGAWADAQTRLQAEFDCPCVSLTSTQALTDWAKSRNVKIVATPHICQGPSRPLFEAAHIALKSRAIDLIPLQNPYDQKIWPHCTKGFFKLKAQIPRFLMEV